MNEYITLGSTPVNESCAQVGNDEYESQAFIECRTYIRMLWRLLEQNKGITPDNCTASFNIKRKTFFHDFGVYYEVVACYNESNEQAVNLAFWLEENMPGEWDDEAKEELKNNGYTQESSEEY